MQIVSLLLVVSTAHYGVNGARLRELKTNDEKIAVTFMGQGWASPSQFSGFFAGLVADDVKAGHSANNALTTIMNDVDIMAAVSGGSWFISQLSYSANFVDMVGKLSQDDNVQTASKTYNEQCVAGWYNTLGDLHGGDSKESSSWFGRTISKLWKKTLAWVTGSKNAVVEAIVKLVGDKVDGGEDLGKLVQFLLKAELSWVEMVNSFLASQKDLDPTKPLNEHKYNTWAHGKTVILATAVAAGSKETFVAYDGNFGDKYVSATSTFSLSSETIPETFVPGAFSHTFGSQGDAPRPFMLTPSELAVEYKFMQSNNSTGTDDETRKQTVDLSYINRHNNKVSIGNACGAASAFPGSLPQIGSYGVEKMLKFLDMIPGVPSDTMMTHNSAVGALLNFALYIDTATSSFRAVDVPPNTQTQTEWVDQVVKQTPMELADGGYVDDSGVALAIAAGATQVIALNDAVPDLFTNAPWSLQSVGFGSTRKIFQDDYKEAMQRKSKSEVKLTLSGSERILKELSYGSYEVTTIEDKYFGIEAGKTVTIHFVMFNPRMEPWVFDFDDYADFAAEIAAALKNPVNANGTLAIKGFFSKAT
mmetsp:Transcript_23866/g.38039  ORF Transcript_23866/g.38039 Transcript_23866/m.38039 type:complete len:589 (-) Transcript_23866:56-1822(-)|eukprot:CAMPEP_0203745106 /NCGR_PEP_ID=MMETSP0098-20131031/957_1 /ASSEMBLY_ACC=CAM_ASM_000208 /TAXON_ID=96639 /ORGANISM=" , Strain NY0313808BC1" /LENGTH=588 /DNA_ID=CAMNT_0050632801 /DNA_START=399 /DNA_END=2165 /DNA_ORIENTATION=-